MLGKRQHGLNEVKVAYARGVRPDKALCQEVRLLLVVAFDAQAVAGLDHGIEQADDVSRGDFLAAGKGGGPFQALAIIAHLAVADKGFGHTVDLGKGRAGYHNPAGPAPG